MLAYTCNSCIRQTDAGGYGVPGQSGCLKKRERDRETERQIDALKEQKHQ
jgi:hypothetical protein